MHRYIWISWEWKIRHMNANHTVKVMKHLGNFANLDFHEYLGWISQIFWVNFCQWKIATCRFHLETINQIWLSRFSSETIQVLLLMLHPWYKWNSSPSLIIISHHFCICTFSKIFVKSWVYLTSTGDHTNLLHIIRLLMCVKRHELVFKKTPTIILLTVFLMKY